MPVVKTIRNHKYQILNESPSEINVVDKTNGDLLRFTRIDNKNEVELNEMFPYIPVLKYKKNGYYYLNISIPSKEMSTEVFRKNNDENLYGRITHTKLFQPVFEGRLFSTTIPDAIEELKGIKDSLDRNYPCDFYQKRQRKPRLPSNGKNIEI